MTSHELARMLLSAPDGEIQCSVDTSTGSDNAESRCFGTFTEVNSLPTDAGFGSSVAMLLFDQTN